MNLPEALLDSLDGLPGYEREAFIQIHDTPGQLTSIRLNPRKPAEPLANFQASEEIISTAIPWTRYGFYLDNRPSFTFDPLFHAGCYYVQEASSMFLEEALTQSVDLSKPLRILDLSAAPGGKSTHIQSLVTRDSLLVSNEVIRSRASILKENIIKWGASNVIITNNDPADFSRLEAYFDVIVVDAPCSGSGLFRKDESAISEWSENNVILCARRQQRILDDVWPALKKNGVMVYSTCSYSRQEDEEIADWFKNKYGAEFVPLSLDPTWGIVDSGKGYRFWPNKLKGEGFYISVFRKTTGQENDHDSREKHERLTQGEREIMKNWVKEDGFDFIKHEQTVYAWPRGLMAEFGLLLRNFRIIYSGTRVGELMRDKLVPDHALALSLIANESLSRIDVSKDLAIDYLKKRELKIEGSSKGWQLITYQDQPLGWINVLSNRINNYYPRELRILKDG